MDKKTFYEHIKKVMTHYIGIEQYLKTTSIDPIIQELIKIRVSQINGCAFCLNMHYKDALKIGETHQRMHLLSAWHDTALFSDKEKAVLDLAEKVTLVAEAPVDEQTRQNVLKYFTEAEFANLIIMISQINTWNRLNISIGSDIDYDYE